MKYHSLQIRIKGKASFVANNGQEIDIADEFSRLSRSLGLESARDSFGGLWATQYVYNDYSSLQGDFLARELHLDLLCNSACHVPFSAIFLCLGESLRRIAQCDITEVTILIEPYAVDVRGNTGAIRADLKYFSDLRTELNSLPVVHCSKIRYTYEDHRNATVASALHPLLMQHFTLPELALPVYGVWSQWEESLRHVETIRITLD